VETKPVSVVKHVENFRQGSVGTQIRGDGHCICQIVENTFRRYFAKNYRNRL